MCELFGLSSKEPYPVQDALQQFFSHSVYHPHGWGLMRTHLGKRQIVKEPACAAESRRLPRVIADTEPQKVCMAHIRLATIGSIRPANCHPYSGIDKSGRTWILMHNGTVFSGNQLMPYYATQQGDTDSERILLYLLDEMNRVIEKEGALSPGVRFAIVDQCITDLAPRNKLNLIFYDGELLYVHKNMQDTLYYKKLSTEHGLLFATQPLDNSVDWQSFPMTRLMAFQDGECMYKGTVHHHIFIPPLDYITPQDAMHI